MPFCSACGAETSGAAFCPKCGASQSSAAPVGVAASPTAGLDENVAGLLCYVLGWITGLIFFLIDKRPFVRFHAAQSIGMSIGVFAIYLIIGVLFTMLHFMSMGFLALAIYPLLGLLVSQSNSRQITGLPHLVVVSSSAEAVATVSTISPIICV